MNLRHRLLTAALFASLIPGAVHAAPAAIAAAVAKPGRPAGDVALDASRKPVEVLTFLGLRKGDRVLDVMAGAGYYAELMARAVGPTGLVIAYEPTVFYSSDRAQKTWAEQKARNTNLTLLVQMPSDVTLAPNSLDFTMMHLTYHDLYWESAKFKYPRTDPAAFLAKLFVATRKGGIVGVVDHAAAPGDTREIADKLHRIDPETVKADFKAAGFVLEGESPVLRVPDDDRTKLVFDAALRGKTDRFVYRFRKPR